MNRKTVVETGVVSALITGLVAVLIAFVGPFRNMVSADDIKDFVTIEQVKEIAPNEGYNADKHLLMKYVEKIDELSKQIAELSATTAVLAEKISQNTKEVTLLRKAANRSNATDE